MLIRIVSRIIVVLTKLIRFASVINPVSGISSGAAGCVSPYSSRFGSSRSANLDNERRERSQNGQKCTIIRRGEGIQPLAGHKQPLRDYESPANSSVSRQNRSKSQHTNAVSMPQQRICTLALSPAVHQLSHVRECEAHRCFAKQQLCPLSVQAAALQTHAREKNDCSRFQKYRFGSPFASSPSRDVPQRPPFKVADRLALECPPAPKRPPSCLGWEYEP